MRSKRARRTTVAHPKFYFFDAGVFRSLRPAGPLDRATEIEGAALEGLVTQHLRARMSYAGGHELFSWRTRTGLEVDFVVCRLVERRLRSLGPSQSLTPA